MPGVSVELIGYGRRLRRYVLALEASYGYRNLYMLRRASDDRRDNGNGKAFTE